MKTLSVAIATRNEQAVLDECLESVKWADEIVIFDEKSADQTVSIAKKYTKLIFSCNHDPMFHNTKQQAINKCTSDWVLQIDADERVSLELKDEIIKTINDPNKHSAGFQVPRKSKIFGKWITHTGWYPDLQVKLFVRGKGHYPCKSLHEMIVITGDLETLKNDLLHEHYSTIDWFLNRRLEYTKDDASNMITRNEKIVWTDALKFPADEFFKRFFYWQGYLDGLHGLVLSLLMAFDRLIVFARIWEHQKYWQYGNENFLEETLSASNKITRDFHYWVAKSTSHPIKKVFHKVRSKYNI